MLGHKKKLPRFAQRFRVLYLAGDSSDSPLNRVGVGFYLSLSCFLICFLKGRGVPRLAPFQAGGGAHLGGAATGPVSSGRGHLGVLRRGPFQA